LGESTRLWTAGTLPYAPEAVHHAEAEGRLIVDALPRHPLARELREVARRIVETVAGKE
jgi:Flp pilus assembly CpaE family ATPase